MKPKPTPKKPRCQKMEDQTKRNMDNMKKDFTDLKSVMNDWIEFLDTSHSKAKERIKELEKRITTLEFLNKKQ